MADSDDILTSLIENLKDGVKMKSIGDRSYERFDPSKLYELQKKIAADEQDNDGPFLPVRMAP
jgi:hypothetical protein